MSTTPLERQHRTEREIRGDGCPECLSDFAAEVLAAEWKYGRALADVVASASDYLQRKPQKIGWSGPPVRNNICTLPGEPAARVPK